MDVLKDFLPLVLVLMQQLSNRIKKGIRINLTNQIRSQKVPAAYWGRLTEQPLARLTKLILKVKPFLSYFEVIYQEINK
jgi:hypothetical protein